MWTLQLVLCAAFTAASLAVEDTRDVLAVSAAMEGNNSSAGRGHK